MRRGSLRQQRDDAGLQGLQSRNQSGIGLGTGADTQFHCLAGRAGALHQLQQRGVRGFSGRQPQAARHFHLLGVRIGAERDRRHFSRLQPGQQ